MIVFQTHGSTLPSFSFVPPFRVPYLGLTQGRGLCTDPVFQQRGLSVPGFSLLLLLLLLTSLLHLTTTAPSVPCLTPLLQ
jgi:hypothetical protein